MTRGVRTGVFAAVLLTACSSASERPAPRQLLATPDHASRVVVSLVPVVHVQGAPERRYDIEDRMKHFHVPGVSIAVVDDGMIAWARGFGVAEQGKDAPVTATTLFQAASISKPIFDHCDSDPSARRAR